MKPPSPQKPASSPIPDGADQKQEKRWGGKKLFQPGESGNPAGRPKGSRNKFNELFLVDFIAAWEHHGTEALSRTAAESPGVFVRVAASLLPRHFKMEHDFADMTDEQLDRYISQLNAAIADELRTSAGVSEGSPRAAAADTKH
jgi:hypothetical protein